MNDSSQHELTGLLRTYQHDDSAQTNRIFEIVYNDLRHLAGVLMKRERPEHTLQPTALVNEAYCRLVDEKQVCWENRAHFFKIAARAMRQILVEHARRRAAVKRGGGWRRVTLDERLAVSEVSDVEIIDLDDALKKLGEKDERLAQVVEMRVFGGLTADEVAHVLGVSRQTVQTDWQVARMLLARELSSDSGE
jgi:RNA polymerase sigma factor (TIGR02999 family)